MQKQMFIQQFEDKNLAHYSYAIISNGEIALIDPSRNPAPYYAFAKDNNAKIIAVIETHPHADFVSSHLEIHHTTGATIYVSKLVGAQYPHQTFDEGEAIILGNCTLQSLQTPGHSPDSISIRLTDETEKEIAVFTGDTLFIGDCGRPDLREVEANISTAREVLAKQMYASLRNKLMNLSDDILVYPAHGAGSLCGKGLSEKNSSTIGIEKLTNWSLQPMNEHTFVNELLADQPFIPKYFSFNVALNKKGAPPFSESLVLIPKREPITCAGCANSLDPNIVIIDTRPKELYNNAHIRNAFHLMNETKFETWLGSIIKPLEKFYLLAENDTILEELIERIAKIGYEKQIVLAFTGDYGNTTTKDFSGNLLRINEDAFTLIDVRNPSETKLGLYFENAIQIPLFELRERVHEIPQDKPIVVHCAGGYRSAAGSSIIQSLLSDSITVYDLGETVKTFQK